MPEQEGGNIARMRPTVRASLERIRKTPASGLMPYALGRFATVRHGYSRAMRALQTVGATRGLTARPGPTMFPGRNAADVAAAVRSDSACFGLDLPAELVGAIASFAEAAVHKDWTSGALFTLDQIKDGRLAGGAPVFVADAVGSDMEPAALQVARDPLLLDSVELYFGYRPIGVDLRVIRSFVVDAPDEERRKSQTIDYHFDVHSYNFAYANFYLSDVDASSGAHVMVLASHEDKPIRWLFGSARASDEAIRATYAEERIVTITGRAGTGFLQDSSCYHKVLAPQSRERLMLHIRYF